MHTGLKSIAMITTNYTNTWIEIKSLASSRLALPNNTTLHLAHHLPPRFVNVDQANQESGPTEEHAPKATESFIIMTAARSRETLAVLTVKAEPLGRHWKSVSELVGLSSWYKFLEAGMNNRPRKSWKCRKEQPEAKYS